MSRAKQILDMFEKDAMSTANKMISRLEKKTGRKLSEEERDRLMKKFVNNINRMKSKAKKEEYEEAFIEEYIQEVFDEEDDDSKNRVNRARTGKKKMFQKTVRDDDDEEDEEEYDDEKKKKESSARARKNFNGGSRLTRRV